MARDNDKERAVRCSFCGKTQEQVEKLIAGPGVYICDECIELCMGIIDENAGASRKHSGKKVKLEEKVLPKPQEIKADLDEYVVGQETAKKALSVAVDEVLHKQFDKLPIYLTKYNLFIDTYKKI